MKINPVLMAIFASLFFIFISIIILPQIGSDLTQASVEPFGNSWGQNSFFLANQSPKFIIDTAGFLSSSQAQISDDEISQGNRKIRLQVLDANQTDEAAGQLEIITSMIPGIQIMNRKINRIKDR